MIVLVAAAAALVGGRAGTTGATAPPAWPDELTVAAARPAGAVPVAVRHSASWCGTTSTTDRPPAVTGYPVRVFYAVPSDGEDHSDAYAPQISDWIDQIDSWWQREDPSRMPRFDLYTAPCGPQIDLQVIRLPSVSVGTTDGHQIFQLLWSQLQSQPDAGTAKYLVFIDDVDTQSLCGVGGPASGATLGSPAMGLATVFLEGCNGADRASVAAHELLHAVSPASGFPNSPHTCPGDVFHFCDSSGDILYPYAESGIQLTSLQLDYGHDDYWAGTAPTNLQVQPWFKHTQDQAHLSLTIAGSGDVQSVDPPGVDCSASCGTDWDRGDVVQLSAASADGYRFVRWTGGGCTGDADCSLTLDASKDVTALFAPDTYLLAVKVAGSGTVMSTPSGLACKRGTCTKPFTSYQAVSLTAKPMKGWHFTGWSGSCKGKKSKCSVSMTGARAVRAAFAKTR
jgi:hypothetical protein